jgi:hypothetical protein
MSAPVPRCPSCEARLQRLGALWRCPWATSARQVREDDVIRCAWPYARPRVDEGRVLGARKAEPA